VFFWPAQELVLFGSLCFYSDCGKEIKSTHTRREADYAPPEIPRVFKGPQNEVEIFFAQGGNQSLKEGHTYDEIMIVTDGVIELERSQWKKISTHSKYDYLFLPNRTVNRITVKKAPVKMVIIPPERQE
jgi:hypothetical protein